MSLYELIVDELFKDKSISALLFLLDGGRELNFKYNKIEYAITWNDDMIYLDNEEHDNIQKYETAWELVENAKLGEVLLLELWDKIELGILF